MKAIISFSINDKLYLRDPLETALGKRILNEGSRLIVEHGLEDFNFKKLALRIASR